MCEEWERQMKCEKETKEKMLKDVHQLRVENVQLERKYSTMKNASQRQLESVCSAAEENIANLLNQASSGYINLCIVRRSMK